MRPETYYAYYDGYARGLVEYACRQSKTISYSYVNVNLFRTLKEIEEHTKQKLPRKALVPCEMSLTEKLEVWMGKNDVVEMMERHFGKCEKVMEIEDDAFFDSADNWAIFYITEDMFLAKFREFYLLFTLGNWE